MATTTEISKLFVALFNRAIDSSILSQYSEQAFDVALIGQIIDTDNALKNMSNQQFVEHFYKNALGKTNAIDKEGIDFWVKEMTDKEWTQAQFIESILQEIDNYSSGRKPSTSVDAIGVTVWTTKIDISDQAAQKLGKTHVSYCRFGAGLPEITANNAQASKAQALAAINDAALRNPIPTEGGNEVTLTPDNPDFLPPAQGESGSATTATKADDTINAVVDGANSTLKTTSRIDAAEGNDTLNVEMKTDFGGLLGSGSITNVEHINLNNTASNSLNFNAQNIKGVYSYSINGANSVNLNNITYNKVLEVNLKGAKNPTTSITFDGNTPSSGALNVGLDNVGAANASHAVNVNGVSQLKVHVTGSNWANFGTDGGSGGITNIIVGGVGSLNTTLANTVTSFNASGLAGNVTLNATATSTPNAGSIKINTGTGNDNVTVDIRKITNNKAIDLGAGNDTLTFTGASNNTTRQYWDLSSVETLVFNNTNSGSSVLSLDLGTQRPGDLGDTITEPDRSANLKVVKFDNNANVTLTGLEQKDLAIHYSGATSTQAISLDHAGATTFFFKGGGSSGAGNITLSNTTSVKLNLDGQNFIGSLSLPQAAELDITNLTAANTFALDSGDGLNDWSKLKTLNITTEQGNVQALVDVSNARLGVLENVKLTGAGNIKLGALNNTSGSITIDGSKHTGDLNIASIAAGTNTIKLASAGNIATGTITGADVTIDLSGATRNNLGDIRLSDNGSQALLAYTTHQGNTIQNVVVNAPKASLSLTGQAGNDVFDIVASSLTNEILLSGDLGSGRDALTINLANAQGTKVDTSNLVLKEGFGIDVSLSKGKDTIILGSSNETIKLKAGENILSGGKETATLTAVSMETGDSLSINGRTLVALKQHSATSVASAIKSVLEGASTVTDFALTGNLRGNISGDWTIATSNETLNFTSRVTANVRDLEEVLLVDSGKKVIGAGNITIAASDKVDAVDKVETASGTSANAKVSEQIAATAAAAGALSTEALQETKTSGSAATFTITGVDGVGSIEIKASSNKKVSGTNAAKIIAAVLEGISVSTSNMDVEEVKVDGGSNLIASNKVTATGKDLTGTGWKLEADTSSGKLKLSPDATSGLSQPTEAFPGSITVTQKDTADDTKTLTIAPGTPATKVSKYIKIEGLKSSADATEKSAEIEIMALGGNVTPTSIAKIVIAAIEGTSLTKTSLSNVSEVKLDGNVITSPDSGSVKITARANADLTGASWKLEQKAASSTGADMLKISTEGQATSINYGMDLTLKVGTSAADATPVADAGVKANGVGSGSKGALTVTFSELKQEQYYTFDGKTVVALRDASAEEVANAFAGRVDTNKLAVGGSFSNLDAATFTASVSGASVRFEQSTAIGTTGADAINTKIDAVVKAGVTGGGGSDVAAVNIITTAQGYAAGLQNADSYVVLSGNKGTSMVASNFTINTDSKLDTISNFNANVDKISLGKVAISNQKLGRDDILTTSDIANNLETVWVNGPSGVAQITGSIKDNSGFITFEVDNASGGTASVNATLGQKLGALSKIATDKIVAFKDGTDVYIVAGGGDATVTRDDAVIKLAGVANAVNNLADILG